MTCHLHLIFCTWDTEKEKGNKQEVVIKIHNEKHYSWSLGLLAGRPNEGPSV